MLHLAEGQLPVRRSATTSSRTGSRSLDDHGIGHRCRLAPADAGPRADRPRRARRPRRRLGGRVLEVTQLPRAASCRSQPRGLAPASRRLRGRRGTCSRSTTSARRSTRCPSRAGSCSSTPKERSPTPVRPTGGRRSPTTRRRCRPRTSSGSPTGRSTGRSSRSSSRSSRAAARFSSNGSPRGASTSGPHSIRNLYFDTASYGRRGLELAIQAYGVEQLVYGSDTPVVDPLLSLQAVREFGESVEKVITVDNPNSTAPMTEIASWLAERLVANSDLDRPSLTHLVHELRAEESLWRPFVRHDAVERQFMQLYRDPNIDVWLICWIPSAGHRLPRSRQVAGCRRRLRRHAVRGLLPPGRGRLDPREDEPAHGRRLVRFRRRLHPRRPQR